jgi:hypothetical protein
VADAPRRPDQVPPPQGLPNQDLPNKDLPNKGLRLRAEDAEDLAVISACLQDALVAVRDLAYDRVERRFMLVANRFCWERSGSGAQEGAQEGTRFERTLCGVMFDEIDGVAYRGFHRSEEDRILSLLAIRPISGPISGQPPADASVAGVAPARAVIDLEFAGAAAIRLSGAAISCRAQDFGEPWPSPWRPGHQLDEQG